MSERSDRRTALLDATLALIAEGGLAAVTHRAVEARAGLPHGSTTYYFRSRQKLIDAAVSRLAEIDHAVVDAIGHEVALLVAQRGPSIDYAELAARFTGWIRARPDVQLIRYELFLAGTRRPEIAHTMQEARASFVRLLVPIAVAAGADDPERAASTMVSLLNGLIFDELTARPPGHAPEITALDFERIVRFVS